MRDSRHATQDKKKMIRDGENMAVTNNNKTDQDKDRDMNRELNLNSNYDNNKKLRYYVIFTYFVKIFIILCTVLIIHAFQ